MARNNDEDEEKLEEEEKVEEEAVIEHINVYSDDDTLPAATGNVPTSISSTPPATQLLQTRQFYDFVANANADLLSLNSDVVPRTALICLPRSSTVKVVYCLGRGASPIGSISPLNNKILMLTGDGGNGLGDPTPIVLNEHSFVEHAVSTMTHAQFSATLTDKGRNYRYPLLSRTSITGTERVSKIAPIPAYLIYDGFHSNLDAAEVYERVLSVEALDYNPMIVHLKDFLLACMGAHYAADQTPWTSQEDLFHPISLDAKRWVKTKFNSLFPTLTAPEPPEAANAASNLGLSPALATALAQALSRQDNGPARNNTRVEEKKDDSSVGMSDHEFSDLMVMCGNPRDGDSLLLPDWVLECAKKGSDSWKLTTIMKHIMNNAFYDDADVPITRPLLKMVLKRDWTGKDGNITRPSMANSGEGLSIFAMLDMDEDEVAQINEADDAINRASLLTFQDLQKLKNARKAKVPDSADEFMLTLKRFANLLFALFSADCPLFKCMKQLINSLKNFSCSARLAMTTATKASILWIILLQSRQFSIGTMDILAEFQVMHTNLTSKQGNVLHAEVPQELLGEPASKRQRTDEASKNSGSIPKSDPRPPARKNLNCWNAKLKAALQGPMERAKDPNLPGFSKILTYCNVGTDAVYGTGSRICSPNCFFGRCYKGKECSKTHRLATDREADEILRLLQKFIENPEGIKRGQSS